MHGMLMRFFYIDSHWGWSDHIYMFLFFRMCGHTFQGNHMNGHCQPLNHGLLMSEDSEIMMCIPLMAEEPGACQTFTVL